MVEYILGNYLVEKGRLSKAELNAILAKQDSVRVKMGLIAVAEGMMSTKQAEEVNILQSVRDKRFGDIAVEEGYLTMKQVSQILFMQGSPYLSFVQALVDEGYMRLQDVDGLLKALLKDKGIDLSAEEDFKSDDPDRILPYYLKDGADEYYELIATAVRAAIRLVDRHIYFGEARKLDGITEDQLARQDVRDENGEKGYQTVFTEGTGGLLNACRIFGKEEFAELDLDALDAAGELLNCTNGLYVRMLSEQGTFMELMPPEYEKSAPESIVTAYRIPLYSGDRSFYFTVAGLA